MPQHVLRGLHQVLRGHRVSDYALCFSTSYADCIPAVATCTRDQNTLPQHVLRGLHLQLSLCLPFRRCFASARPTRIASRAYLRNEYPHALCLSTSYADCIRLRQGQRQVHSPLPQHVLRGLHRDRATDASCHTGLCLSTSYADCILKGLKK